MNLFVLLLTCIAWAADPAIVQDPPSFDGRWYGMVRMEDGREIVTLVEAEEVKSDWVLRITQLADNRNQQPVLNSTIQGSSVSMSPHIGDSIQSWTGELVHSGNSFRGEIKDDGRTIGSFELVRVQRVDRLPEARTWIGNVIVPGSDFEQVHLRLAKSTEGWLGEVNLSNRHCYAHPVAIEEVGDHATDRHTHTIANQVEDDFASAFTGRGCSRSGDCLVGRVGQDNDLPHGATTWGQAHGHQSTAGSTRSVAL